MDNVTVEIRRQKNTLVSEQIVNGTSAQIGYTVPFGTCWKIRTEDK